MQKKLFEGGNKSVIYADGGARGNPGPAACGFVVAGKGYGEYLGETTNNIAEYQGIIHALKKLKALVGSKKAEETEVEARLDSELLVRQFNNEYRINDVDLKPLYVDVHNLVMDFKKVTFVHIPREKNKEADRMVNKILDERG